MKRYAWSLVVIAVGVGMWLLLPLSKGGGQLTPDSTVKGKRAGLSSSVASDISRESAKAGGASRTTREKQEKTSLPGASQAPGQEEVEAPQDSDAAEKAVTAYEGLVDSLMEPVKGEISLEQVDDFVRKFKALPKERQDEELHHALNLIPDDNSLFLLGVLMDAEVDKELKELVFNDFLNRGDEVKQPMLKAVFKQKSHPCWADAAWILDVTGALPAQKAQ